MTTLFEIDRDIYENDLREEAKAEGRKEGIKEGKEEERKAIIFAMYQNGLPINQIASIIKIDIKELEKMIAGK